MKGFLDCLKSTILVAEERASGHFNSMNSAQQASGLQATKDLIAMIEQDDHDEDYVLSYMVMIHTHLQNYLKLKRAGLL